MMDEIFGKENFRNEVVWKRTVRGFKGSQFTARCYNANTDHIFFYSKKSDAFFDMSRVLEPYSKKNLDAFKFEDSKGKYYRDEPFRRRGAGDRHNLCYEYKGFYPPHPTGWQMKRERLEELDKAGDLEIVDGKIYRKIRPKAGKIRNNLWDDIPEVKGNERTGYPTQKPLKLLERIILASSNEGDMVFDPFCGCATTCVAAEKLNRQWVGVDISPKAIELVKERISNELGLLLFNPIHRTDIPGDRGGKRSRDIKNVLYGKQEGMCGGCGHWYRIKDFEVDHVTPRSKGGSDTDDNLQLLCGNCNRIKGDKSQEYLISRVRSLAG